MTTPLTTVCAACAAACLTLVLMARRASQRAVEQPVLLSVTTGDGWLIKLRWHPDGGTGTGALRAYAARVREVGCLYHRKDNVAFLDSLGIPRTDIDEPIDLATANWRPNDNDYLFMK